MPKMLLALVLSCASLMASHPAIAEPILQCTEICQQFAFNGSCNYRTSCTLSGDCMTSKTCAQFDYRGLCLDEAIQKTCAVATCPGVPATPPQFPITCEIRCQKRDSFGRCLYTTGCEIQGRCIRLTDCERFDNFGKTCLSERIIQTCY